MAVDGSSVAVQVGTAAKFPLASNCGRRFVDSVQCWWLWFLLPQGVIAVPACVHAGWHVSGPQGVLGRTFPSVFAAPSSAAQVKSCRVAVNVVYPLLTKLFLLPVASMQWLCLPGFERLPFSFFFFCYRHVFQRAFSFIFLKFDCVVSRPLAKSQWEIFGGWWWKFAPLEDSKLFQSGFAGCMQRGVCGSRPYITWVEVHLQAWCLLERTLKVHAFWCIEETDNPREHLKFV